MSDDDHPLLTTVGVAAVALGLLMVIQPGLAAAVGVDYYAVVLVGLIALVQAIRVARDRQHSEIRSSETPDVETVETVPTPGEEFDRTVATLRSGPRRVRIRSRADLREQLEEAAVTAVADRENCSPAEAEERIEAGTWTDDAHAAAFLGGPTAPQPSLYDRMKLAASPETQFQHRIRRAADAVARTAGVTPEDGGDAPEDADGDAPDEPADGASDDGTLPAGDASDGNGASTASGSTSTGSTDDATADDAAADDGTTDASGAEDGRAEA